jgi:hypothetical protein
VCLARFSFLDHRADDFYPDWDDAANTTVDLLRTEAGRDPRNRDLTDLVGEPATQSDEFRVRWAAHNVRLHRAGTKYFRHPAVGTVDLAFDALEIPAEDGIGLTLTAYSADSGSPSEDASAARPVVRAMYWMAKYRGTVCHRTCGRSRPVLTTSPC